MVSAKAAKEFYQQFANQKLPYKCIARQAQQVHIQFSGYFDQQCIIWDAQIMTLKHIAQSSSTIENLYSRQFIQIQTSNDFLVPITIALNLENITVPDIRKTIIMINNYKLLKIGKHEYGEIIQFD